MMITGNGSEAIQYISWRTVIIRISYSADSIFVSLFSLKVLNVISSLKLRNIEIRSLLIYCSIFIICTGLVESSRRKFRTSDNLEGNCFLLQDCEPLYNLLRQKLASKSCTKKDFTYYKQYLCGPLRNRNPPVCCPPVLEKPDYTEEENQIVTVIENKMVHISQSSGDRTGANTTRTPTRTVIVGGPACLTGM
ncbi:uncharacterized protein LOC116351309 [Contarinia nasturtii]|uniref:uncharacterized protein LOC116351309 n=1 Tax=Contarinia nasturtii TaxID=265458 RepID=UPI0012D3990C|nr:uncharacterized protein LOC116351309 [Contarinia nasturtii]